MGMSQDPQTFQTTGSIVFRTVHGKSKKKRERQRKRWEDNITDRNGKKQP